MSGKVKNLVTTVSEIIFPGITISQQKIKKPCAPYPVGYEFPSYLPLQIALYYNLLYFFPWLILNLVCLMLKFEHLPSLFQKVCLTVFITSLLIEIVRLYVGYSGNLEEKVALLAACWLLTIMQIVALSLLTFYGKLLVLPLESVANVNLMLFAVCEAALGYVAVRRIAKKQSVLFHVQLMKD